MQTACLGGAGQQEEQPSSNWRTSDPLNADLHISNGLQLLSSPEASKAQLFYARSAFERASLLSIDDPVPQYLAGYTHYLLGEYTTL